VFGPHTMDAGTLPRPGRSCQARVGAVLLVYENVIP
jgi:hypothetical protein